MAKIEDMLRKMEEERGKPRARARARPAPRPARREQPAQPAVPLQRRTEMHEVYEIHGAVVVHTRVFSKENANDLSRQLRSLSVKLASYCLRKFGIEVEVIWNAPKYVRSERVEVD